MFLDTQVTQYVIVIYFRAQEYQKQNTEHKKRLLRLELEVEIFQLHSEDLLHAMQGIVQKKFVLSYKNIVHRVGPSNIRHTESKSVHNYFLRSSSGLEILNAAYPKTHIS